MFETIFKTIVDTANRYIWESPTGLPWLVVLLLGAGIFITFRMGGVNVRHFKHAINIIRDRHDNPVDAGDINHLQALTNALSATVGVGNIAGLAVVSSFGIGCMNQSNTVAVSAASDLNAPD